jgi:hypothetical protein
LFTSLGVDCIIDWTGERRVNMDFNGDTRWMMPMADPSAFVMDEAYQAAQAAARRSAGRLERMIRLVCGEDGSQRAAEPSFASRSYGAQLVL